MSRKSRMRFRGRGTTRQPELEKRRAATQATLDRYRETRFSWPEGTTCVHLARYHLRKMGHRPEAMPELNSAAGAKRALKERGWKSVTEMLDSMLPRIPPAKMLLGDLAVFKGTRGLDTIMVCAGPQAVFGWRADGLKIVVLEVRMDEISAAWRL